MNAFWISLETLLGLVVDPKRFDLHPNLASRNHGVSVTLATVRLGHKRSLPRKTPFDAVLLIILAAVLSRAINGSAPFSAILSGGVVLVLLHRLFAFLTSIRINLEFSSKGGLRLSSMMENAT